MLVGESLVVSRDIPAQMRSLIDRSKREYASQNLWAARARHVNAAIEAGADMLGLIFYDTKSSVCTARTDEVAAGTDIPPFSIREWAAGTAKHQAPDLVGVFVNEDASFINDVIEQAGLHFVQLHGNEPPEFCQLIKRPVIKALHLDSSTDTGKITAYQATSWRILLDTPSNSWGGTGETHDWSLARSPGTRHTHFARRRSHAAQRVRGNFSGSTRGVSM